MFVSISAHVYVDTSVYIAVYNCVHISVSISVYIPAYTCVLHLCAHFCLHFCIHFCARLCVHVRDHRTTYIQEHLLALFLAMIPYVKRLVFHDIPKKPKHDFQRLPLKD